MQTTPRVDTVDDSGHRVHYCADKRANGSNWESDISNVCADLRSVFNSEWKPNDVGSFCCSERGAVFCALARTVSGP